MYIVLEALDLVRRHVTAGAFSAVMCVTAFYVFRRRVGGYMQKSVLKKLAALSSLAIVLAAASLSVAAQAKPEAPAPALMDVTWVTVKPDMTSEFQDMVKNEFNPALIKGGLKESWTWHNGLGDAFSYVFVSSLGKMAEMDGPSPIEKGLGAEAIGPFFKKAGTMVTSVRSTVMMERPDLSFVASNALPKMAVVVTMKAAPGRQTEFETYFMNEFMPAFKKSEAKGLMMHQLIMGGDPHEYVMLVPIDNWSEIDKGPPVARSMGMDAWKKLRDRMPGAITDINVMKLMPALSIMPAATK